MKTLRERVVESAGVDSRRRAEWYGDGPLPSGESEGNNHSSTLTPSTDNEDTFVEQEDSPVSDPSESKARDREVTSRAVSADDEDEDEEDPFVPSKRQKLSAKLPTKSKPKSAKTAH